MVPDAVPPAESKTRRRFVPARLDRMVGMAMALALAGCAVGDDAASKKKKPAFDPGPPPEVPAADPESTDAVQRGFVGVFLKAVREGERIEQASMVHPSLLASWGGVTCPATCDESLLLKIPAPDAPALSNYWQSLGFRPGRGDMPQPASVRAWAVLDRPCVEGAPWRRAVVWIAPGMGGWRVLRYTPVL